MADRPKMSVAEMLAAARKADGDGSGEAEPAAEPVEDSTPAEEAAPVQDDGGSEAAAGSGDAPAKIAMPGSADRPSVSDILAMARSGKSGGEKEKPKPKPKAAAKKAAPAAAKPAAKAGDSAPKDTAPKDTASILAAARGASKAGPMSKAEAAAKAKASPKEKAKLVAPPMPEKPDYAKPKTEQAAKPAGKAKAKGGGKTEERRDFLWIGMGLLGVFSGLWSLMLLRFLFPNVLREPPSKFKVGFPDAFAAGTVATKFKAQYGVWVVNSEYNGEPQLVALKTVCTHLGCTPSWLEAEQKYKCPCHGSGFYKDGINFEGPAPRPLERYAIRVADDGQVEIDKSRTFQEEMGQWADQACYIPV
ncbi:MAG: ubiquinol-cytochrome c reductase iron-sulfur subunit [Planctomycetota bacterium]